MRTRSRSVLAITLATATAAGCGLGPAAPAGTGERSAANDSVSPSESRTPRPIPTATPLPAYVVAVVDVGVDPGYAEIAFGSVWVGNHHGDSISRIDPATNAVIATIEVPGEPTGVSAAFDSIWTFTPVDQLLQRIDPATDAVVATLALDDQGGSITGVQALGPSLWFAGDSGHIRQIDPVAMSVLASLDMVVDCPGSLAAAAGLLWYAPLCGGDGVAMIDPAGPSVKGTVPVPGANAVWSGLDALWVSSMDGTITKLDPTTGTVLATGSAGPHAEQLRTGLQAVWVRVDGDLLVRMDPATLEVTDSYDLPPAPIPGGGIAIGEDAVWAVNFGQRTIWRIAP
jgi:YVTN family beta-propeller protein